MKENFSRVFGSPKEPGGRKENGNFELFELGKKNSELVGEIRRIFEDDKKDYNKKLEEMLLLIKDKKVKVEEGWWLDEFTLCEFCWGAGNHKITFKIVADPRTSELVIVPYGGNAIAEAEKLERIEKTLKMK